MRGHALNTPAQVFRAHCSICGVTRRVVLVDVESGVRFRMCSVCDGPSPARRSA